jgi:CheY-like chemotaxis protein/two-component sensor histidine kinase
LSKIEAGKVELHIEKVDVVTMLRDVAATVHPLMEKNRNTLKTSCHEKVGVIESDLTRLRQVLFNLLSNAAKFTEDGQITLEAAHECVDHSDWVVFRVGDSGIGMTPEQVDHVFEAFQQADASTTRKYGGTGLGLTITKSFCEIMGGGIKIESEEGKGTTFIVRLPVKPPLSLSAAPSSKPPAPGSADETIAERHAAGGGKTILVIDDDSNARSLIQRSLNKAGFHAVTAPSGELGLALARKHRPVAITLDVMMPTMDGWAVLRQLKTDPALRDIPVIMLTMVEDKEMGYALGASDYLSKPVDRDHLLAVLNRISGDSTSRCVMVVEDDPNIREILCRSLSGGGWEVEAAENGQAALECLGAFSPNVIILDLMMPEMDGFEFVKQMRRNRDWQSIPILVLTAKDLTAEDFRRLNGSVERILRKGDEGLDQLLIEVRRVVGEVPRGGEEIEPG